MKKSCFFPKITNRISIKLKFSAGPKNRLEDRDEPGQTLCVHAICIC